MGGAPDFPERASSPLKRRASSMEPDNVDQDASEDVDMITAPENSSAERSKSEQPGEGTVTSTGPTTDGQRATPTDDSVEPMEVSTPAIKTLVEEQDSQLPEEGQQCYLVSKTWLSKVPDIFSPKHTVEDWSSLPPIDNSDIIEEVIDDPCVGETVPDILKRKFVRLKPGCDQEQFQVFPPKAWELLMQWPGLKEGQLPIRREAHSTKEDGSNIIFEWHPPVLTIYRLWSAISAIPIEASLKAKNPPPARLVRSRSTNFQTFLKQAKRVAGIDLVQRVRAWSVLRPPIGEAVNNSSMLTPPHDAESEQPSSDGWNHLLLEVTSFVALERNSEREVIEFGDLTAQTQPKKSTRTLGSFSIAQDQAIVLDPHESGTLWTSTLTTNEGLSKLSSEDTSTSLTVQNRKTKSGRTSPVSQGPLTRGRSQRSGRVLGCVGLGNLGNTCYMNAALQCVRSVEELTKYFLSGEWEKELNKDNVLSHDGEVAAAYAHLLKDIYKDNSPGSLSPRQFKTTIGKYSTGFSGFGQQDTQEFLGFLLDGLQEDLSRIKKKPYIEKPDSTDEMVKDPAAIRQMAEKVWDITKKRDDSVIADLFTGLYKSTLVCPECQKVSITFDPFNNLTLPLPVESKWSHTVKFVPLNDRPIDIKIELDKHASIKALKEFLSSRTGVPAERLFGSEEWRGRFYKHYGDLQTASEEIANNDHPWFYELEAKPTNWGGKQKSQKVRSMIDDGEGKASSASWDDERAERMVVPVFHRRPATGKSYGGQKWQMSCAPHFIVLTPEEARSEDAIRRKVLEKVITFTKNPEYARADESDGSDTTEPEIIRPGGSDTASSNESRVVDRSVTEEDDLVDIQMKDASSTQRPIKHRFSHKRPYWIDTTKFLPPRLQNLFELGTYSEAGAWLPTGMNGVDEGKSYQRLSLRIPLESPSSEDQLDTATNGTASNEESSSDEAPRRSSDNSLTRMNEESEDEDPPTIMKRPCRSSPLTYDQPSPIYPKQGKQGKKQRGKGKNNKKGPTKKYGKQHKTRQQREQRQRKEKFGNVEPEPSFSANESSPDGGPLVRLHEALVVEWSEEVYEEIFLDSDGKSLGSWNSCETLPDPELDKAQAARSRRRKHGISLEACLDEFEREEILSEQDMWYCPRCKDHRRASKKFDLWKTPDILIIHLKRFSSSGFRRDKLEVLVDFPLEDLDITSRVLQKEDGKQEVYDLIGVDCHWGGLGGGHYTAHAKNFVDGEWYTYNDSSVTRASVDKIVDASAYLLFYRRRSEQPLGGPRFQRILEKFADPDSDSGEDQRLGEGSSRNGSSGALQGVGADRPRGKVDAQSNPDNDWEFEDVKTGANISGNVHQSIEDDEGIDVTDNSTRSPGFQSFANANSWSFSNIVPDDATDLENAPSESHFDGASDTAQIDSSGDERVLSPREFEPEIGIDYPGMSHFESTHQQESPPPLESVDDEGAMEQDVIKQVRGLKHTVHQVQPNGDTDEDVAEIHVEDIDKIT
ncbi:hypothetical protein M426DRAFT_262093 [Hypoxylon sp. CI-4A]|nr:hypothetical protein M426DRAFT_262093 [Hypoxylon sp. CI-4A]